ncbi:cullin C, partial [Planoprotostelium fungivorum]
MKKKITIKPYRQVSMDPDYADKTWKLLQRAIHEIHKQNASGLSFEELYRNAYNMVLHKYGDMLYNGLKTELDKHLEDVRSVIVRSVDEEFLSIMNKSWGDHKVCMLMIRDILMYMDRVYVQSNEVAPVYELGLQRFRDIIARAADVKDRLLNLLLSLIEYERNGNQINRGLIKSITQMLVDLRAGSKTVYEEDFERNFLDTSSNFFKKESQEFISSNSCSDYMKKVESRIKEELERVNHYMDPSTEVKLKEVVERELISNHMRTLVDMEQSGCISMLRDNKIDDLKRMYLLFGRVPQGHNLVSEVISKYIKDVGKGLIQDEEKQKDHLALVQALLDMKDKYDVILSTALGNDKMFSQSMNQAFEYFINLNSKSAEYISLFIDEKLKKGLKGVSEAEVDVVLDKVMMLFRFLQEKDVFEKYYKQHLAKRLLLGRSVSDDVEQNMISKLKAECGFQFTSKLAGMFTDMKLSKDTMEGFKSHCSNQYPNQSTKDVFGGVDLSVNVLTTGFWPTAQSNACNLPQEVIKACEAFKKYYLSCHNGRKLSWQTNMGSAEVKAIFDPSAKVAKILSVSTHQMVALLLFNDRTEYTCKEINDTTNIPAADLKRNLMALSAGKQKILIKSGDPKK